MARIENNHCAEMQELMSAGTNRFLGMAGYFLVTLLTLFLLMSSLISYKEVINAELTPRLGFNSLGRAQGESMAKALYQVDGKKLPKFFDVLLELRYSDAKKIRQGQKALLDGSSRNGHLEAVIQEVVIVNEVNGNCLVKIKLDLIPYFRIRKEIVFSDFTGKMQLIVKESTLLDRIMGSFRKQKRVWI